MQKEISFNQRFKTHLLAGCPGVFIQSGEEARVDQLLTELAAGLGLHVKEWNLGYGWVKFDNKQPIRELAPRETDLAHCLPLLLDDDLDSKLIVIKNAKLALENNNMAVARLKQLLNRIQRHHKTKSAVVLVSESLSIPAEIEAQISLLPLPLPSRQEIDGLLNIFCKEHALDIPESIRPRLSSTCSGLSQTEIVQVLSMVAQQHTTLNESALEMILREKEQIIAKSGVLEMVKVSENISDIGGLDNLKDWLKRRAAIIRRLAEAEQFGISAPKGVLIAGMPGCGKSLAAKVAAHLFQLPLLRLDIGSLLGKYVGESENNMRRALQMAETVSPCILWVDELEKAFVGMGGGNASEVTSRLLGYFLTWMQEKTGAVFVIATANDITALPPELLRKGRFDETFYVGFPNIDERKEILGIHLAKAGQKTDSFDMAALAKLCRDYSGADIQNAVNEALENAFVDNVELTQELISNAINSTVSLRESLREQVGKYEELFEKLKLKPASLHQGLSVSQMIKLASDPNQIKREEVASHPECPNDLLKKLADDPEFSVKESVYNNPACPPDLLSIRMNIDQSDSEYNEDLLRLACSHPNVPMDLLLHLLKEDRFKDVPNVLNWIIGTTRHPDKVIEACGLDISHAGETQILLLVPLAINGFTSERIQQALLDASLNHTFAISHPFASVFSVIRQKLASNPATTEYIQLELAKCGDIKSKLGLMKNLNLFTAAQRQLAKDEDAEVRIQLAQSDVIDDSTKLELAGDKNQEVRIALVKRMALQALLQEASKIPSLTTEAIWEKQSNDPCLEVRFELMSHIDLSKAIKKKLSHDPEIVSAIKTRSEKKEESFMVFEKRTLSGVITRAMGF
jgi:SpoVK/Ycf46/Vps4 family AAA+-type ATPase